MAIIIQNLTTEITNRALGLETLFPKRMVVEKPTMY